MGSGPQNEENKLNEQRCIYCQGRLELRLVNRLQRYQARWVMIENLPAMVCIQCGEHYYTPQTHDLVVTIITRQPRPERTEVVKIYDAAQVTLVAESNSSTAKEFI